MNPIKGVSLPAGAGVDGVIVGAKTDTTTELGPLGEYRRVYTTEITVEVDTADLAHLDLLRPITITQKETTDD